MNDKRPFEDGSGFEEAYRQWGSRPARTSARDAADLLIRRVDKRRPMPQWTLLAAAATIVTLAVGGWWLNEQRQARRAEEMLAASAPAPLDNNVVLSYLDSGVPVYFVITTSDSKKGGVR